MSPIAQVTSDGIAHPPFEIDVLPQTDLNEDRFRIRLSNSGNHYYIAINSTVLAVLRGTDQLPVTEVVYRLADRLNILRGDPPVTQDNYRLTEENNQEPGSPELLGLEALLERLPAIGGDPSIYRDTREGTYN